jgi:hypothetical protein
MSESQPRPTYCPRGISQVGFGTNRYQLFLKAVNSLIHRGTKTRSGHIRVGWRLLHFFIFFAVLVTALQYLVMKLPVLITAMRMTHTGTVTPLGLFGYELANIVSAFVALAAMTKIEKRRFGDYGLRPFPGAAKRLAFGFAFGLLMVTAIRALQRAEHVYSFGSLVMAPGPALEAGLGWAVAFL